MHKLFKGKMNLKFGRLRFKTLNIYFEMIMIFIKRQGGLLTIHRSYYQRNNEWHNYIIV